MMRETLYNLMINADFLSDYWERKPFIVSSQTAVTADMPSLNDLKDYLSRHDIHYPAVNLQRLGKEIAASEYTWPLNSEIPNELLINSVAVKKAYEGGQLVMQNHPERVFSSVYDLSHSLSQRLKLETSCSILALKEDQQFTDENERGFFLFVNEGELQLSVTWPDMDDPEEASTHHGDYKLVQGDVIYIPLKARLEMVMAEEVMLIKTSFRTMNVYELMSNLIDKVQSNNEVLRRALIPKAYKRTYGAELDEIKRIMKADANIENEFCETFHPKTRRQTHEGMLLTYLAGNTSD